MTPEDCYYWAVVGRIPFDDEDNAAISVTLDAATWEGLLLHLEDTLDNIPVTGEEPDLYECVDQAMQAIKIALPSSAS